MSDTLVRMTGHPEEGRLEIAVGPVSLRPGLQHYRVPVQLMRWPHEGWLQGCSWAVVDVDRSYRAEIVYENTTDDPAPHGGMGLIAGVAWTDEDDWPALDRENAAYRADLWNTVTAPIRAAGQHSALIWRRPRRSDLPGRSYPAVGSSTAPTKSTVPDRRSRMANTKGRSTRKVGGPESTPTPAPVAAAASVPSSSTCT